MWWPITKIDVYSWRSALIGLMREAWNAANEKVPLPSIRKVQLTPENPGHPVDDIGLAAVFLASPLASWVTGQAIAVAGGQGL